MRHRQARLQFRKTRDSQLPVMPAMAVNRDTLLPKQEGTRKISAQRQRVADTLRNIIFILSFIDKNMQIYIKHS